MSEQDFSKITGGLHRARDLYRVHDSSGKQKKQQREMDENEFKDHLEDSEKEVEGYDEKDSFRTVEKKQRNEMLDQLSITAPPIKIEQIDEDGDTEKKGS